MKNSNFCLLKLFLATCLALSSCISTPTKKPPTVSSLKQKRLLKRAKIYRSKKQYKKALTQLTPLIKIRPRTDLFGDALILRGTVFFDQKRYKKAFGSFIKVVRAETFSPKEAEAIYLAALSLYRLGQVDESLTVLNDWKRVENVNTSVQEKIHKLYFILFTQTNHRLGALRSLVSLSRLSVANKNGYRRRVIDFVQAQLNESELQSVADNSDFDIASLYAKFTYGKLLYGRRYFSEAKDLLLSTAEELPGTGVAETSRKLIRQIDARRHVNPMVIGAVLPLSGRHAKIGYRTLRGLELGLGIRGKRPSDFELAIIDSENNPDVARRAVQRLVVEDNVIAIVGSLLSKTSLAVAEESESLGVPNIGLSQKVGLTALGENVFRNSVTSRMHVRHLVKVAMEDLGYTRFAILYPNDAYGMEYANFFWEEVLARGGSIQGAQIYRSDETDFSGAVQRLIGTFYIEDRLDEYTANLGTWKNQQPRTRRRTPPDDLLPPVIDFQALFIPDGPKAIGQIAPMLAYHDVSGVRLLGTNLWNSGLFVRRGKQYVEKAVFIDSFLAQDKIFVGSSFYREFESAFGQSPSIFEVQAYDSAMILRQIILSGALSRIEVRTALARLKNAPGVIGPLMMGKNREIHRPLVALTVKDGLITHVTDVTDVIHAKKGVPSKHQ